MEVSWPAAGPSQGRIQDFSRGGGQISTHAIKILGICEIFLAPTLDPPLIKRYEKQDQIFKI